MESEYKLHVMHEQSADFSRFSSDNLVITESLHTHHHHSSHTLTELEIKSLTKDNQPALNNNCTRNKATNTVVQGVVDSKLIDFVTHRHGFRNSVASASVAVLSYSEENINNNRDIASTSSTGVMSHQNFVLSFEHQQTPSPCETLLSPAEAPFGRRYAEISQFKNHPNVEW